MLRKTQSKIPAFLARRYVHGTPANHRAGPPIHTEKTVGEAGGPTEVFSNNSPITLDQRRSMSMVATTQQHENDRASFVLVHVPGQEIVMGSYHPCGALFECTISLNRARDCIYRLRDILESNGVAVRSLGEVLRMGHFSEDRERLKKMASHSLTYNVNAEDIGSLQGEEIRLTSEQYKDDVVGGLDVRDLVDVIVTQPTVYLAKSGNNTPLKSTQYTFKPLSNLIFTRDQMIVTAAGAVLANLNSAQREPEVNVVQFCLEKLGLNVLGKIEAPGTLEGGDFYPCGTDLCFIGMGIRTNDHAIQFMMKKKMFGTRRVAVVADLFDRNQARMHLDCVANIASDNCWVVRESILGKLNPKRRLVTEYVLDEVTGEYKPSIEHMEFGEYLTRNGFHIIPASEQMADDLGINFINMGDGELICPDEAMAEQIESFPHFHGKVHHLDYREVCKMYGAVHCTTQVFRTPRDSYAVHESPAIESGSGEEEENQLAKFAEKVEVWTPSVDSQSTDKVLLVAPTQFRQNNETLTDNDFMQSDKVLSSKTDIDIIDAACEEFQSLYSTLLAEGVGIQLYHHEPYHGTPDACFPNNWFSTHINKDGTSSLALYPMAHPSRRRERRPDIMKYLKSVTTNIIDLSDHEDEGKFLEGTGSMVLDRTNKVAYAVLSSRTDSKVFEEFCKGFGYTPFPFQTDPALNMYHTNVMMSIGTNYAAVCFDYIHDKNVSLNMYKQLKKTGRQVITLSKEQCSNMAGNILELRSSNGDIFVAMSDRAYRAFTKEQLYTLLQCVDHVVHPAYNTIETLAGGSVRCSIAEIF
eukprot:TRINITY_DN10360_c0_g1_i1.p1 TRINITY_DN10360_c0_g1~~TRINITY_DN10360_c0_g1_i1.p1  ORF type:complete len:808 (+),score=179.69 TRINITY_DN10360_c0_g1_i1:136-2559(+)